MVLITLILFFASGMYDEKIRYAHAYVLSIIRLQQFWGSGIPHYRHLQGRRAEYGYIIIC